MQPLPATAAGAAAIAHAASAPLFVARLATHARDTEEERKAIVFNHPWGEIRLENHPGVIDDAGGLLLTSLSGSSDASFHQHVLWDEISEL